MPLSKTILRKQLSEKRLFTMEFGEKMVDGEVISTIDSHVDDLGELTFENPVVAAGGQGVSVLISGGAIPTRADCLEQRYKITIVVTTDSNQELENDGILIVADD